MKPTKKDIKLLADTFRDMFTGPIPHRKSEQTKRDYRIELFKYFLHKKGYNLKKSFKEVNKLSPNN